MTPVSARGGGNRRPRFHDLLGQCDTYAPGDGDRAESLYGRTSKAALFEAALYLAATCSDGGCDDLVAGLARLEEELRILAQHRGAA